MRAGSKTLIVPNFMTSDTLAAIADSYNLVLSGSKI